LSQNKTKQKQKQKKLQIQLFAVVSIYSKFLGKLISSNTLGWPSISKSVESMTALKVYGH